MYETKKKAAAFKMCFKACMIPFIFPENFYYVLPEHHHQTCEPRTASTLKTHRHKRELECITQLGMVQHT